MSGNQVSSSAESSRQSVQIQDQQQKKKASKKPAVETLVVEEPVSEEEELEEDLVSNRARTLREENLKLRAELAQLKAIVEHLSREHTLRPDNPVPSTESPLTRSRQPLSQEPLRYSSTTPDPPRVKLSERTPTIENLSDGVDPTF